MDNFRVMAALGIVPVVAIEDADRAVDLAKALLSGGINIIEITFRTEAALEAMKKIKEAVPETHIGAGTVLSEAQIDQAIAASCEFIVSPGLNEALVKKSLANNLAVLPGVLTPSELMQGLELGLENFKFFPAKSYGGAETIKALSAPFSAVKFVPTGGIRLSNLADYLKLPSILAIGGTWLATKEQISEGRFVEIESQCMEARSLVDEIRKN